MLQATIVTCTVVFGSAARATVLDRQSTDELHAWSTREFHAGVLMARMFSAEALQIDLLFGSCSGEYKLKLLQCWSFDQTSIDHDVLQKRLGSSTNIPLLAD
jgi:hypothetical protein